MNKKFCKWCGEDITSLSIRKSYCDNKCVVLYRNAMNKKTNRPYIISYSNKAAKDAAIKDMPIGSQEYFSRGRIIREVLSLNDRVNFGLLEDLSILHLK